MGENMLSTAMPHVKAWWGYIIVLLYAAGFFCFTAALVNVPKARLKQTYGRCILGMVAGVALLNAPGLLNVLSYTLFSNESVQELSYTPPGHEGQIYVQFAVYVVAVVGLCAIARGILIMRRTDQNNHELSRALIHLAGGIICVNLPQFLRMLGATLGGEVQTTVELLIG